MSNLTRGKQPMLPAEHDWDGDTLQDLLEMHYLVETNGGHRRCAQCDAKFEYPCPTVRLIQVDANIAHKAQGATSG